MFNSIFDGQITITSFLLMVLVAVLTGMSKSHLYKLTCSRQIPFYRPNGKLVYFDRQELEGWLKQNRVTTQEEAEQQAIAYVMTHKK